MNERTGWGAALASVCSAELIMIAVITGAGLATVFLPEHIDVIALIVAVLVAGGLLVQRRRARAAERTTAE